MKISLGLLLPFCCFVCNPRGRVLPSSVLQEPFACYVVYFTPGPAWLAHPGTMQQELHDRHIQYTDSLMRRGNKSMGGTLAGSEGTTSLWFNKTYDEVRQFVHNDPAVSTGIYDAEIKEWKIAISNINYRK